MTSHDPAVLPPDLPVPVDDGAADHLPGLAVPALALPATTGEPIDLAAAATGTLVLSCYPRTGRPGEDPPPGWDAIPGARGCTPQACAFRDHHAELAGLGARMLGLSAQPLEEQVEAAGRLRLPYPLLSDPGLALAAAMRLPTFQVDRLRLYRRPKKLAYDRDVRPDRLQGSRGLGHARASLTLVARAGRVVEVFYPVFPPDRNAAEVAAWLRRHPA
jgi:peroxiredoxin